MCGHLWNAMPSGSRDLRLFVEDMLDSASTIIEWTSPLSADQFFTDRKTYDAVLRNLTVMGEAAKQVPGEVRDAFPEVPWRAIAGFRDLAMHSYFGLSQHIVWSIVSETLPGLVSPLAAVLRELPAGDS